MALCARAHNPRYRGGRPLWNQAILSSGLTATSSSSFTVTVPPTITSFTPTGGPFGTVVTITGTNFSTTPANNSVYFSGSGGQANVSSATSTQLICTVPSFSTTGPISVMVGGLLATSSSYFTVQVPTITSFTPISGPPGTVVTIAGTNFSTTLADDSVYFYGASTAVIGSATSTQLVATVPANASTGPIDVIVNGVGVASSTNFTVTPQPAITGFAPTRGPVGTSVTIVGTNFSATASNNIVQFNGIATTVTYATTTQLSVTVPIGATTGPISVTEGGLSAASTGSFTVTTPPIITGFTPTSGLPGTVVTITGTNFSSTPSNDWVGFNGAGTYASTATPTQLVVTVPAGSTTGPICVQVSADPEGCSSSNFTVLVPTITSFTPTSGPDGTVVTITGTNFSTTPANDSVFFYGAYAAVVSSATSTQLVATIPSGATTGPIQVVVSGIGTAISSSNFTVPVPTITSFTPASGPAGTAVTLTGTNFSPIPANNVVTFNGAGAYASSATSDQLVVTVPEGSATAPICDQVNGGPLGCSSSNFTVPVPTITSFTPTSGPVGTVVTITGGNFSTTQANDYVTLNGKIATVSSATPTQLIVIVPSEATTDPICVQVSFGTAGCSSSNFTVLVLPTPIIANFTPTSGPAGTEVTISGSGLTANGTTSTVTFNGTTASVISAYATQIVATVPQGATSGPIAVTVGGQSVTSSTSFNVVQPGAGVITLAISGANPEPSIVNQSYTVQITVTGSSPAPTGTILVEDQNNACVIDLPATSCMLNGETTVGEVSLTATYSGDVNYQSAVSPVFKHITNPAIPTEMCGLDPQTTPNDPPGFVPITQLSGIVYTPGLVQDITGNGTLSVTIVSPAIGATTADSTVDVVGTFVGPTNTGITVNGIVAYTVNGQFLAPGVPLSAGANTLTVVATTLPGATATYTTSITQDGPSPSLLSFAVDNSTGSSGFVPMAITFDTGIGILPNNVTVQSVAIDVNGDGIYDYTAPTLASLPTTFTYSRPGLYTAAFRVIDSNSNTYIAHSSALIQDIGVQRAMLCDVYACLKDRLSAQDSTGASNAYQPLARSQYQQEFATYGSGMPSAVPMLGAIANGRIGLGYADMTLVRDNTDETRSGFPLRMTQGSDGVWRISEM